MRCYRPMILVKWNYDNIRFRFKKKSSYEENLNILFKTMMNTKQLTCLETKHPSQKSHASAKFQII